MTGQSGNPPAHFLVVIPGIMGSKLRDRTTGELVWVDFSSIPFNPFAWSTWIDRTLGALAYPNDNLKPDGIMDEVIFVPPWAKQEQYSRLVTALTQLGYTTDSSANNVSLYTFAYDWRQDNRVSARQLATAIEGWRSRHPNAQAWIIAHSNGGLVARWYIEKEGGKAHVGRLFLLGSPWDGAPKALDALVNGLIFLRRWPGIFGVARRTRDVLRTFPAIYQLLPASDPFLRDVHNERVDLFTGTGWLDDPEQRRLLADGLRFNQELGTTASVDTLCFFGRKKPTTTAGMVFFAAGDRWDHVEWTTTAAGDGTVPERSAAHPDARFSIPVPVSHGDIYVSSPVLAQLEWELVDRYRAVRAEHASERLHIVFNPDRDIYRPGELIAVWATVHGTDGGAAVRDASVEARLAWRSPLPGQEPPPTVPADLPSSFLDEVVPGRYEAQLIAPASDGYYELIGTVEIVGERPLHLTELIAVESDATLSSG